jgi:endonuclease/exonuclease/phosphatase family metal-dependent hydrolase
MSWQRIACTLAALAMAGCGSDGPNSRATAAIQEVTARVRVATPTSARDAFRAGTYNAGLALGALKYADERVEPVVEALAHEDLDLLCVQEFWLDDHWRRLVERTAQQLPHTHRLPPEPADKLACTATEAVPLSDCAAARCGGVPSDALGRCVLTQCAAQVTQVSGGCMSCLARDPRKTLDEVKSECVDDGRKRPRRASHEGFYAYGGSYGTGLLSRSRMLETDSLRFDSVLSRRGVLYARLATESVGEVHAFCTHLTAAVGEVPRREGSWDAEHRAEVEALLRFVDEKSAGAGRVIVLGDMNTGPGIQPHVAARWPEHYRRLAERLHSPYAALPGARCTYCYDNPLDGQQGTRGTIIDHILLRGFPEARDAGELLRRNVWLEVNGKQVRTALSDHVGVVVTLPGT